MAVQDQQDFVTWLRGRIEDRGYVLDGRSARLRGQSALSQDSRVEQSVISRVVSGRAKPSVETLIGLAGPLGVHPIEMLERAGLGRSAQLIREALGLPAGVTPSGESVLDRIASSKLPEDTRRKLAGQYRGRLARLDQDFVELIESLEAAEA